MVKEMRSNKTTIQIVFFLLTIMVVDIAALLSIDPSGALSSSRTTSWLANPNASNKLASSSSSSSHQEDKNLVDRNSFLVPSQVAIPLKSRPQNQEAKYNNNISSNKNTQSDSNHNDDDTDTPTMRNKNWKQKPRPRTGNIPDVFWRNIPMDHIRQHPYFIPLPLPENIHQLGSIEDVRNFRQESWQWDVLHDGRMTTSQAVAALGFLEPIAGEILGVPKGLRRGGQGAYHRLRKPLKLQSNLQEMNSMLCGKNDCVNDINENYNDKNDKHDNDNNIYWTKQSPNYQYAAKYMVPITEEEHNKRRNEMKQIIKSSSSGIRFSIRMMWGNVQESTSLLTALNYFWKIDNNVIMKEIGMCGAGLDMNNTSTGLLFGATPDAILCHPDGRIEAVEVKNHCPFIPNNYYKDTDRRSNTRNKVNNNHRFRLSRQELLPTNGGEATVMIQNIPQLMMEMLCIGEECKSAIMVRQSAMTGSLILRIHRDDDWINEMLYWLNRFNEDYVKKDIIPPTNFFHSTKESESTVDDADQLRYKEFLNFTKRIEKDNVQLLQHVPNRGIQRATGKFRESMDLFFD
ncbi:MAG: hypothetical protein ACI90V_007939 [Bacillariaceae sp.]|jgi:hypothetical protein